MMDNFFNLYFIVDFFSFEIVLKKKNNLYDLGLL